LWQKPISSGKPKIAYFLEYAENTVFCAARTILWEKIQRECAVCVVGTHCSEKCQLVLLLDYGDMSLAVQFNSSRKETPVGFVLCSRDHSVGGRGSRCFLCNTNSLLRVAQTSALPRI
jgi:hypothetical protein